MGLNGDGKKVPAKMHDVLRLRKKKRLESIVNPGSPEGQGGFVLIWSSGLGWAGLGWAGLDWAGLGWAGMGWGQSHIICHTHPLQSSHHIGKVLGAESLATNKGNNASPHIGKRTMCNQSSNHCMHN